MKFPYQNAEVERVFAAYPVDIRRNLEMLRTWIFEIAEAHESVGPLEETLKWGQPSYLTTVSGSGTTVRIDQLKKQPGGYGMFVHCQTTLLSTYRDLYTGVLRFNGKRGVIFNIAEAPPESAVHHCIALALTYHQRP